MSLILVAVLIIGGLVGAAAVAVGIPVLFGIMAYDIAESRKHATIANPEDTRLRIAVERNVARGFVVAGGAFWSVAIFAGLHSFSETGIGYSLLGAFIPAVACAATLIIGWYYERVTAALLTLATFGVIAWGVIYQFEAGVWAIMVVALMGPMMTAAVLFWLARRDQEAFELAMSLRPEVAPVPIVEGPVL